MKISIDIIAAAAEQKHFTTSSSCFSRASIIAIPLDLLGKDLGIHRQFYPSFVLQVTVVIDIQYLYTNLWTDQQAYSIDCRTGIYSINMTENHNNQDPRYSQKTIYYAILANQIWSWILCSPVVGKSLTPNYRWVQTYLPCVADVHHEAMIDDRWSVGCAKRSCEYLPLKRTILYDPTSKHTEGKHLSFPSSLLRISSSCFCILLSFFTRLLTPRVVPL